MKRSVAVITLVLVVMGEALASAAWADEKIITIGTAGVTGVYYPAGGAICRLVNRGRKEHGVRCTVESTDGSVNNLEELRKGEIEFGIVQSDLLYHAYRGSEGFAGVGPDEKLRVVFSLHAEPFTVVARKDAGVVNFDDLKGKRINLGMPGSGPRATMEELMRAKGWTEKAFSAVYEIKPSDQAEALCSGKIDATIFAAGHPNGAVQQLTSACPTALISVTGPAVEAMIRAHPFFGHATIPGGMYVGNTRNVQTFGFNAILVASSTLDADEVYQVVKAVFDNLDDFKTLHPVFATLDAAHMALDTGVAPLHAGAARYYKERNLITSASNE